MQPIRLVEIVDPLNSRDHNITEHFWKQELTLAQLRPTPIGCCDIAISINGMVIPQNKMSETYPQPGDWIVIAPIPAGGGGLKSILRIVATIALAVVAPYAAAGIYAAAGGTLVAAGAATALAAITGGVLVAGALLISALLPPPRPKSSSTEQQSPNYGIDGAKNTALEGIPVPVPYGTFRVAGNVLGSYIINDASTAADKKQYLHMLINLGEGEISSIDDIRLNDQKLETFVYRAKGTTTDLSAYEVYKYLGTSTQGPIQWFSKTISPHSIGQKIITSYNVYQTSDKVDRLRIDLVSPSGIFRINSKGANKDTSVTVQIDHRLVGSSTWLPLQGYFGNSESSEKIIMRIGSRNYPDSYNRTGLIIPYVLNGDEKRVGSTYVNAKGVVVADVVTTSDTVTTGSFTITSAQRNAWRGSITSVQLTEGVYELRYRRTDDEQNGDTTYNSIGVSDINEIKDETVGYRNTALLAIKLLVTDKLNGVPTVTSLVTGKKVQVWNKMLGVFQNLYSANPAWVAFDALTNTRYGGGAPYGRFDLARWKEWADYCTTAGLEFHGSFDTNQSAWDAIQNIMRCGHAQIVPLGTKYSVAIERPEDYVMLFSVANMQEGSFKINWLPIAERANEIELTYQDRALDYKQQTIKAVDQAALANGQSQRTSQVSMMGVTDAQTAWNEANLMLNLNRYILQTVSFSAPSEAVACTVGDVILVQHDMPSWGAAGRLEAGSTTSTLKLDRVVSMQYGKAYQVLLHLSNVLKYSGTVKSVAGNSIVLNSYSGAQDIKRLLIGAKDMSVDSIFQSGSDWGVIVNDASGISSGQSYGLYSTDEIVVRTINNIGVSGQPAAETIDITLAIPLSNSPAQFTSWTFGETNKNAKPFRVKSISGNDPVHRDISAIEYNASVYNSAGAVPTKNYSNLDNKVEHAVIIGVSEVSKLSGSSYKSVVTITFGPANARSKYSRSEVLYSIGENNLSSLGFHTNEVSIEANVDDYIRFIVIARDDKDRPAESTGAPEAYYRVEGETTVPGQVTGTAYSFQDNGIVISWNAPDELTWQNTIVRRGSNWTTAQQLYAQKGTNTTVPFLPTGTTRYLLRHELTDIPTGTDEVLNVVVSAPATPSLSATNVQGSYVLQWGNLKTSQPLKLIEVRVGATFSGSTLYQNFNGSADRAALTFQGDGTRLMWVRAQDVYGNWGTESSLSISITGLSNRDTTPPPTPTGLTITSQFGTNYLVWNTPTFTVGAGPAEMLVYGATYSGFGALPAFSDSQLIDSLSHPANKYADSVQPGTIRLYWIASKTKAGVIGAQYPASSTAGVQVTTARLASIDMDNGIIDAAKFASTIEPVTNVISVPTTKLTNTIFNTTDSKTYRWNGTAYTAATSVTDLNGQIAYGQIAAGAVRANEIAAGSISATKLVLYDTSNAYPDPDFNDPEFYFSYNSTPYSFVRSGAQPNASKNSLVITGPNFQDVYSQWFPLEPNAAYNFSSMGVNTINGAGGGTTRMYLELGSVDNTGAITHSDYRLIHERTDSNASVRTNVSITTGSYEKVARILYRREAGGTSSGQFSTPIIRRQSSAELIVDGAITAVKIKAGSITGDRIQANTLNADRIVAGTINTDRLVVGSVSANVQTSSSGGYMNLPNSISWTYPNLAGGSINATGGYIRYTGILAFVLHVLNDSAVTASAVFTLYRNGAGYPAPIAAKYNFILPTQRFVDNVGSVGGVYGRNLTMVVPIEFIMQATGTQSFTLVSDVVLYNNAAAPALVTPNTSSDPGKAYMYVNLNSTIQEIKV